jgi:adenosine deaminase
MEVRFSPVLHGLQDLTMEEAVEAPLRGLLRAEEELGIRTGIIVCGIRNMSPETSMGLADLTVQFKGRGVVAFDLAGAEYNNPAKMHRESFYRVGNANVAATIHAGEAYGPESIHQALHYCNANRIGHGTRLFEDPDLMRTSTTSASRWRSASRPTSRRGWSSASPTIRSASTSTRDWWSPSTRTTAS